MFFDRLKSKKLLLAELSLIISSVFIFRSLWLLMDKFTFFQNTSILVGFFLIGIITAIPALRYIIRQ